MGKSIRDAQPDSWKDIVGMPDEWDFKNLQILIRNFKKRKFSIEGQVINGQTYIDLVMAEARHAHGMDDVDIRRANPYNIKSAASEARVLTAVPPELNKEIQESYPTLFRDKDHSMWFATHFPEFRIAVKL